jgi:hypothetical protein
MAGIDGALNGLLKLAIAAAVIGAGAFGVMTVLDRMTLDGKAAERRALLARNAELNVAAVTPGSVLACLDGGAGEAIQAACEKSIFADPQKAASAVAYTGARLALLADAQALADPAVIGAFAAPRRAIELDRYGIAAHVLSTRDGCTAERCPAFAWLHDSGALKANMKAQAFDTYVARYAGAWNKPEPEKQVPVAAAPVQAPPAIAALPGQPEQPTGQPVSSKYDFPSSASIPAVSIMNAEPALPKEQGAKPGNLPAAPAAAPPSAENAEPAVPVPPKRPQTQAVVPPPR